MACMFQQAKSFNQPLNNWNASNVNNMACMFQQAKSFNQNISNWNVSNVKINRKMYIFDGCKIKDEFKPKFNEMM